MIVNFSVVIFGKYLGNLSCHSGIVYVFADHSAVVFGCGM